MLEEIAGGEAYSYRWLYPVGEKTPDGLIQNTAEFATDDGLSYKVKISGAPVSSGYELSVDFGTRSMGDQATESGEPFRIFSTVAKAAREVFTAHGDITKLRFESVGPKRERIYRKLVQREFPSANEVSSAPTEIVFEL